MLEKIPVTQVAGVGPAKARALADLGIHTVADLLTYFPERYDDLRVKPLLAFGTGERVRVLATIQGTSRLRWQGGKSMLEADVVIDGVHSGTAVWFNQHYLQQRLCDGRMVVLQGKWDAKYRRLSVSHTAFSTAGVHDAKLEMFPVYRATQKLSSPQLASVIEQGIRQFSSNMVDMLPYRLREKYRLVSRPEAISWMHRPSSSQALRQAHRRLAFEEFFLFQLQLQYHRSLSSDTNTGIARAIADDTLQCFSQTLLPNQLTAAQADACADILQDLRSVRPMARLLQGDVGSGKTWVALFAAYAMFRAGFASALMAPTEILAEQHFREAKRRLDSLGMAAFLLTGSLPSRERTRVLENLREQKVDLLIGTHALLTEDVDIPRLGLVVTDEQHRFGVSQRSRLQWKGQRTDVLYLSATPIPRTLALAVYGDLEVSVLAERPKGRQPIETKWYRPSEEDKAIRILRRELVKHHQVYVVAPMIEDSDKLELTSATSIYAEIQEKLAGFRVALLHGRQSSADKDATMRSFSAGEVDVLVATTVIEVGIDVQNATGMLIYHADRFGLAQLHQLRGRIGRGVDPSVCILLAEPSGEIAKQRLETMVSTTDGFVIAEKDLELRGPGEFLGVRQSGLPEFTVGDLSRDLNIMEAARSEAKQLLDEDSFWIEPKFSLLRDRLLEAASVGLRY